jgi:histidinol-phosphate aminotransferase
MQNTLNRRQWLKSTAMAVAAFTLQDVDAFASDLRQTGSIIRLDMNENPYGISAKTSQAIKIALNRSNRYPRTEQAALQDLIASQEKVTRDCVLLGAGCTEIFSLACLLYGANGKEVLVADPNYYLFNSYVKQLRGELLRVPVNERWEVDLNAMAHRASKRTRLVYVCNPNNPTGTIVDPVRLRQFSEDMARRAVVFVDEAYYELVEDSRRASMIELVRKGANLVVGRTFSKLFGLAGLRVGYGVGNPQIIEEMRRIQVNLAPVNELGIAAARAAYADAEYIALTRQHNAEVRARFYTVLEELGYQSIPDSQTNFVSFRTRGARQQLADDLLQKYNIGVHAARFLAKDWVRVSMGTPAEMDRLTAALQKLL